MLAMEVQKQQGRFPHLGCRADLSIHSADAAPAGDPDSSSSRSGQVVHFLPSELFQHADVSGSRKHLARSGRFLCPCALQHYGTGTAGFRHT